MIRETCKTAVILAAGMGTRVRTITPGRPKCLMALGGRPIIGWILASLERAEVTDVVVVTGFGSSILRHALGDGAGYGLRIRYVHNRRWREPNGLSLYAARRALSREDTFLAMMSDHLLHPRIIEAASRAQTENCILAVDTDLRRVFDLSDATKVRLVEGKPVAIGKRLRNYNAVDCGLFRFDGRVFEALRAAIAKHEMSLSAGVKRLIADGDLDIVRVSGSFWIDIDTPKAYREAARRIEGLRRQLKL
jgi:choline kinase